MNLDRQMLGPLSRAILHGNPVPPSVVTADLLPCPRCGSSATWLVLWCYVENGKPCIPRIDGSPARGKVKCQTCGMGTAALSKSEAHRAWNRRTPQNTEAKP